MTPLDTIQSVYDAFTRGDIAHIINSCDPDVRWRQSKMVPWGGEYHSPAGVAEFFGKLAATVETTLFEVDENMEVGPGEVHSFGRYGGKSPTTGKSAVMPWMFRWRVKDGKVVLFDSYVDSGAMQSILA